MGSAVAPDMTFGVFLGAARRLLLETLQSSPYSDATKYRTQECPIALETVALVVWTGVIGRRKILNGRASVETKLKNYSIQGAQPKGFERIVVFHNL